MTSLPGMFGSVLIHRHYGTLYCFAICRIEDQVVIVYSDYHVISSALRKELAGAPRPANIGNNTRIGRRFMIIKDVNIR